MPKTWRILPTRVKFSCWLPPWWATLVSPVVWRETNSACRLVRDCWNKITVITIRIGNDSKKVSLVFATLIHACSRQGRNARKEGLKLIWLLPCWTIPTCKTPMPVIWWLMWFACDLQRTHCLWQGQLLQGHCCLHGNEVHYHVANGQQDVELMVILVFSLWDGHAQVPSLQ